MIFSSLSSRHQEILLVAIALLSMYMQANYTGPELHEVFSDISSVYPFPWFSVLLSFPSHPQSNDQGILRTLEVDGEMPYQLEKYPLFLSCAESLLLVLADLESSLYVQWWLARSAVAHHRCLLGNPSPTLCERVRANQTAVEATCVSYHSLTHRLAKTSTKEDPWEMIRCLVEEGLFYLYTFETEKANPFFLRAMECGCGGEVARREPAALRAHGREGSSHQVPDLRHVAADRQRRQVSEERGCEE